MKTRLAIILLFAVFAVLAACARKDTTIRDQGIANGNASPTTNSSNVAPVAAQSDELAEARNTFTQVCAKCHQADGTGGNVERDGKTLRVPSLISERAKKDEDEEYVAQIANGGDGMPAFKNRLKPEQIDALVRYIRKEIQGK